MKRLPETVPFSRIRPVLLGTVVGCLVLSAAVWAALQSGGTTKRGWEEPTAKLLARGQSLYTSLCARCHGADGDATDYAGIVPLAGIDLRLPAGEIADLSAPFVGRTFRGEEAQGLVAYLATLGGTKGLVNPGYLFSPRLLHSKFRDRSGYRILDARRQADYEEGHIPNALPWPTGADTARLTLEGLQETLARSGVSEQTFVVVYDETGGPAAASVWWSLQQAGHLRAAILDGGLRAWRHAGHPVSKQSTQIGETPPPARLSPDRPEMSGLGEPTALHLGSGSVGDGLVFNWRQTVDGHGLLHADAIDQYLERIGLRFPAVYRIEGNRPELGFLVWLLSLTGREASYARDNHLLTVRDAPQ